MATTFEFETERLNMRQWHASDFEPFARMNADPKVMKYFPNVLTRLESDALAKRIQSIITERGWGFWALEIKNTQEFIGFVGLHIPTTNLPFSPCVEVGWRLTTAHWGNGYVHEAAIEALRFGFDKLGQTEIVSFTAVENYRSQNVMKKLGMQKDIAIFEHPDVPAGHALRKHCLYRLSSDRWQAMQTFKKI
jgi:RimJ/RimL family protein N-acetyltransferase